jgi:hypothetical protein
VIPAPHAIGAGPAGNPWVVNTEGAIYQLPSWDDLGLAK